VTMRFARPEWLKLLWALLPAAGLFWWSLRNRRIRLERVIAAPLLGMHTEDFSPARAILKGCFLAGFFCFGILAAARPQWGIRLETLHRHGVDVIAALDTSYSMAAEDVIPSRIEKAKGEIKRVVEQLEDDRVGLVSFAGNAVLQCPLTLDRGAVLMLLDAAATGMEAEPGTSLASAISRATSAFSARETKYKALVLFTDGEDLEGQVDAAVRKAAESGVVLYAVGVGTPQGAPIPVRDARGDVVEYRKDPAGQVVVSRLDEQSLSRIARETGGRYFRATTGESEIGALCAAIAGLDSKELDSRLAQNLEDRFQVPLALAVACLAASFSVGEKRRPSR